MISNSTGCGSGGLMLDRVAGHVAGCNGYCGPRFKMLLLQHLWSLGRRRLGGRYRDIFLGVGGGPPVAEMSAAIRTSIGQGSALLLTVWCDGKPDEHPLRPTGARFHFGIARWKVRVWLIDLEYLEEPVG